MKKKWIAILCILIPILVIAGYAVIKRLNHCYTIEIDTGYQDVVYVEFGAVFTAKTPKANYYGGYFDHKPVAVPVTITGSVEKPLGSYKLTYTAQYAGVAATRTCMVIVQDTRPPEIQLQEIPGSYTIPGERYTEEGVTATDNHDGILTAKIVSTEKNGQVHYVVSDSSGNVGTAVRTIRYYDPTPPELELYGGAVTCFQQGKAYVEPGYLATDNCEGNISGKVKVTGSVDGSKAGTYELQYTVSDNYGNEATAVRIVRVTDHPVQEYSKNPQKVIYLTYDDGPGKNTPRLLDILGKYNVKATFFVVNTSTLSTITRAAQEGHTVAVHSSTHKFKKIYASEEAFFADYEEMLGKIVKRTGIDPQILRFPGGSSNTISKFNKGIMTRLAAAVEEKGLRYFDWNVDSNDAGGATTAEEVFNNVVEGIGDKKIAIVLQHDVCGFSVDAVENIILWGLENGYTFLPLTKDSPVCHHTIKN